jgi:hypothetical protein
MKGTTITDGQTDRRGRPDGRPDGRMEKVFRVGLSRQVNLTVSPPGKCHDSLEFVCVNLQILMCHITG